MSERKPRGVGARAVDVKRTKIRATGQPVGGKMELRRYSVEAVDIGDARPFPDTDGAFYDVQEVDAEISALRLTLRDREEEWQSANEELNSIIAARDKRVTELEDAVRIGIVAVQYYNLMDSPGGREAVQRMEAILAGSNPKHGA